jgi:PAS domain S-box-containing protein
MPRPVLPDALEACPDALFTTDADGRIVDWGPGAQATYGYSAEEAIG